jgi:hypothetical protein
MFRVQEEIAMRVYRDSQVEDWQRGPKQRKTTKRGVEWDLPLVIDDMVALSSRF